MQRSRGAGRGGFTVLELLVVIMVLGILAALILPAVQTSREVSRRNQCRTNLQGLGQALQNFESAHQRFPPIMPGAREFTLNNGQIGLASSNWHSPHVQLLPYLDQQVLYDQFDLSRSTSYTGDVRETLPDHANTILSEFLCPSDGGDFGNNYRFCTGEEVGVFGQDDVPTGAGPFSDLRGYASGRFVDGFSNTVAVSEAIKSDTNVSAFGPGDYWISSLYDLNLHPTRDEMINTCGSLTTPPPVGSYFPYVGHTWALSGYDFTLYNHTVAPNAEITDCTARGRPWFTTGSSSMAGVHKASSRHPGGVNVLMMDGSARFISDSISLITWRALASIAGKEVISSNSF